MKKTKEELGYFGMFAHRDTVQEAYDYAVDLANTVEPGSRVAAMTGIQVLVNTYAVVQAAEKTTAEKMRQVMQFAYCMDLDKFEAFYDKPSGDSYAREKWGVMNKDFLKWFCNLDSAHAERFVDLALGDS